MSYHYVDVLSQMTRVFCRWILSFKREKTRNRVQKRERLHLIQRGKEKTEQWARSPKVHWASQYARTQFKDNQIKFNTVEDSSFKVFQGSSEQIMNKWTRKRQYAAHKIKISR